MQIQELALEDIEDAIAVAASMHAESAEYRDFPFEADLMRTYLFTAINQPGQMFAAVLKTDEGKLVGGILALKAPYFFSGIQVALEMALYILPEYRGMGRNAIRLIEAHEAWAQRQGCKKIQSGVTADINSEVASGLYERMGYRNVGPVFRKDL